MRLFPVAIFLIMFAVSAPASSDENVCADLRIAEADYFKPLGDGELFSEERMKMVETYLSAHRKVLGSSREYGFGASVVVQVIQHLERTADLGSLSLYMWLGESELAVAHEARALARQIEDSAERLTTKLADVICQMREHE